jgi:hypothetical protein
MSYSWFTMSIADHKVQEVETYGTLEEILEAMSRSAWDNDSNRLVDWVCDEEQVAAVAIFGPGKDLLVTCADGRMLTFQMPESYKE